MSEVKIFEKENLLKAILSHDIISFDIFDTLLLRPFADPTDLFFYIEDITGEKGFAEARISAEQKLRTTMRGTEEVHLSEIYAEIPEYKDLMQVEMDTEFNLLHPNPLMFEIYQEAQRLNKTIIIVSDIYLPEDFIAKLLNAKGYTKYHKLYVSSTWNKEKWTGNLFRVVLETIDVAPSSVLHIGDNYKSDICAAEAVGMHSFHIKKIIDCYLEQYPYRKDLLKQDWKASALTMILAERAPQEYDSYWHRFGFEFAGPICYAFTKWIQSTVHENKDATDIVFVARDGYILNNIYKKLPTTGRKVKLHYIYAPRLLSLICRLDYDLSYYDCLSQMNMIVSYFAQKSGQKSILFTSKAAADQYIKANYRAIKKISDEEGTAYRDYLGQQKFGTGEIVIVDSITDKFSAQKLIGDSIENSLIGLYWCVLENSIKNNPNLRFKSFQKEHKHVLASWDIMEFILSSPEPSIHTIENGKPVYNKANSFEATRVEIFKDLYKGVQEFVDTFLKAGLGAPTYSSDFIVIWANQFLEHPKEKDIEAFQNVKFSINPDHSDILPLQPFRSRDTCRMESTFVPRSFKDRLWLYSQKHPVLYKILHAGNIFQKRVIKSAKNLYVRVMRFFFRPVINAILFSRDGFTNGQLRNVKNDIDIVQAKLNQMEENLKSQSDFLRLLEVQSQYTLELMELQSEQREFIRRNQQNEEIEQYGEESSNK